MKLNTHALRDALGVILLVATAFSANAEQRPQPLPADGRIKTFVYNENTVYRLDMHTNFISTVQFGKGEVVESIQVGDSASWQIIRLKRGDVISIKPLNQDAVTNMTVYTDRRVYSFELRAHRGSAGHRQNHNFRTAFQYPTGVVSEYGSSVTSGGRGRTSTIMSPANSLLHLSKCMTTASRPSSAFQKTRPSQVCSGLAKEAGNSWSIPEPLATRSSLMGYTISGQFELAPTHFAFPTVLS